MKFLLIICFSLITVIGRAQDSYIGKTFTDIDYDMKVLGYKQTSIGTTKIEGESQATYAITNDYSYGFFFNTDNVCIGIIEILGKELVIAAIENLNKDYIKVDDNTWLSKDNNYKLVLKIKDDIVIITHIKI